MSVSERVSERANARECASARVDEFMTGGWAGDRVIGWVSELVN